MRNKLILLTTVSVGVLLSQPAFSSRVRFEFTQTGFPEGAIVTGSFEGEDINNDGKLNQQTDNEISLFHMAFSGNSSVPAFTTKFIKNDEDYGEFRAFAPGLIYRLDGGPLGSPVFNPEEGSEGIAIRELSSNDKLLSYRAIDAILGKCRSQLGPPLTTHICGWVGHFALSPGPVDFFADIHTTTPEVVSVTQVSIEPTVPGAGNQVSGFVWLDNNTDGLQNTGEPGFAQAIPGYRAPSVALYPEGSSEFLDITLLDENSNGQYVFKNVPAGDYYVCISNEFRILDLDVTAQNTGDDEIDSDFDTSPCTYGVTVSAEQGAIRDLGLTGGSVDPGNGNQVSGFVWLDNNADGLLSESEPGFAQTVPNFGAPSVALYPEGSIEFIDIAFLDEGSNGQYQFNDVPDGNYYVCVSNEFRQLDLSVTTQNAGDDAIDSDFDGSPCTYGISVNSGQTVVRDLGLVGDVIEPVNGNQVSGFVWLDNNGDGLQSDGEPGFAQTVPDFGAPSVALYPEGSTEFIDIAFLDESSNGLYQFDAVPNGNYYVCVSNEFRQLGLNVTTQDAGDDAIDSDFDTSPCSYGITVSADQGVDRDLGLQSLVDIEAFVGYQLIRVTPSSSLNPEITYNSISISAENMFSVRDRLIAKGVSSEDALNTAIQYVRTPQPVAEISGNGAFVRRISGGGGNVLYQPDIALAVNNVVVDEVNRGFARLTLTNATVNKKIYTGAGIDNLALVFKNSTLCGVYFETLVFPGRSSKENPCP